MLCRDCGSFRTVEERSITNTFTNHFKGCSTFPTHCGRVSTKRGTSRLCTKAATWEKKKKKYRGKEKAGSISLIPFFGRTWRCDLEQTRRKVFLRREIVPPRPGAVLRRERLLRGGRAPPAGTAWERARAVAQGLPLRRGKLLALPGRNFTRKPDHSEKSALV